MTRPVVVEVRGLTVRARSGPIILEGVDLSLRAGEITVIVGETGSGKTTLLNSMLGLMPAGLKIEAGEVLMDSIDLTSLDDRRMRSYLGLQIGYVPQDVRSGLNPLMTARQTVQEAASRKRGDVRKRADLAMSRAGLSDEFIKRDADRRPGGLSGGQCQRVLIAQAIVNEPRVVLMDEPTASLDPFARREVQTTIRGLLDDHCAIGLVTHDVSSLKGLADAIGVMYLGRIVEIGPASTVLDDPRHFYTKGLWGCVPPFDRVISLRPIPGDPPMVADEVPGCKFHPRCEACEDRCRATEPRLLELTPGRKVACHVAAGI